MTLQRLRVKVLHISGEEEETARKRLVTLL